MARGKDRRPSPRANGSAKDSTANLGFEANLWLAANKLRNNMDAAEYKHVVLGFKRVFEEHAVDIWRQIHANQAESRTLAAIRDALLPKLLSGELPTIPS